MDRSTLRTGAVGALKGYLHPVSVAREIMRRSALHEFPGGEGAASFRSRNRCYRPPENLIDDLRRVLARMVRPHADAGAKAGVAVIPLAELCRHAIDPETGRDTTVFLAHDSGGRKYLLGHQHVRLGLGASGDGWADSPDRLGAWVLCRHTVRRGGLHRRGRNDDSLLHRALDRSLHEERRLGRRRGAGGGGRHARPEDRPDQPRHRSTPSTPKATVIAVNGSGGNVYWLWEGSGDPVRCPAEAIPLR